MQTKPSTCLIHLCTSNAYHRTWHNGGTELLLMDEEKINISFIHLFTGETLVQLLLGFKDHLPVISVTPWTASLHLASAFV